MSTESIRNEKSSDPAGGPLFVVGVPRSGTSLLYCLLNQHPQIALMYEGNLPFLWPLFLTRGGKSHWLERWNFWRGGVERHRIDISKVRPDVPDTNTATELVCREYARQKGAAIWGDKIVNYYGSLALLLFQFPNARFVVVWRDPADVSRSIIRAGFGSPLLGKRGMAHRALMGCFRLGIERDRLLQRGVPVHDIFYEDLVRSPTDEMVKICEFLRIPFDCNMGSLEGSDRSAIGPGEFHALVRSQSIVSSRKQPEVLPVKLRTKIERYKVFWREKHSDWPIFRRSQEGSLRVPSLLERVYDQVIYRFLRRLGLNRFL